jgi:transcriptional regulator with XRE-family HTH domain
MTNRPSAEQRREFGAFLSSRRARLQPKEYGSAGGPAAHTAGLRREEVAVLAGVSVSWYTWLEQGRDIQPSADALQRISKVLKLTGSNPPISYALSALRNRPSLTTGGEPKSRTGNAGSRD